MCEKRIESNCLATKGIKLADWNKDNRMLKVIFNEKKISLEQIHKKIASIGHDTKLETAPDESYNNLECASLNKEKCSSQRVLVRVVAFRREACGVRHGPPPLSRWRRWRRFIRRAASQKW